MRGALSIIGAGRVGRALGKSLRAQGWRIGVVVASTEANARKAVRFIGDGKPQSSLTRIVLSSSVILISTPDDVIGEVAAELARIGAEELRGKVVLHTSGTLDASALKPEKLFGAFVGSIHPLQTFSRVSVPPLEGRVFAVEGDPVAMRTARQIVRALGGIPVQIEGCKKPLYHAGAVLAAGLILAVEESSTRLLMATGMKRREAIRALLPLTRQVLDNFEGLGARSAWTGPLARGDYSVIATHIRGMKDQPVEITEAYVALNRLAARVLSADPQKALAEIEKIVVKTTGKRKATEGRA